MSAVLALAASRGAAVSVVDLVALVGRGHRIVAWHHHVRPVRGRRADAVLAADVAVLGDLGPSASTDPDAVAGVPVACQVHSAEDLERARSWGVAVAFTSDPALRGVCDAAAVDVQVEGGQGAAEADGDVEPGGAAKRSGAPLVWVPPGGIDLGATAVVPLLTRARLRLAHGLPDPLVLAVDRAASPADCSTSLALASAAVVSAPLVPLALALGTPSVVTADVAGRLGLQATVEHPHEVVVAADATAADRSAATLARDEERAAATARRARRFAEQHLDLSVPVARIRRVLGLEPPSCLIDLRLDELGTPAHSRLWTRSHRALSLFTLESPP